MSRLDHITFRPFLRVVSVKIVLGSVFSKELLFIV